jgi:sterol desaturase/sphingolipid hydroxylase (fatty acid hydroxylase superfamily)
MTTQSNNSNNIINTTTNNNTTTSRKLFTKSQLRREVIQTTLDHYIKAPFLLACLTKFIHPFFFQKWFSYLIEKQHFSSRVAYGLTVSLCHASSYSISVLVFECIEYLQWWEHYRIARTPIQNPPRELRLRAIKEAFGSWIGLIFGGQVLYEIFQKINSPSMTSSLPSLFTIWYHISISAMLSNGTFYIIHRILHLPYFYKRIHKIHHEFVGTVSMAAEYTHPVEGALNIIPALAGALLLKTHPVIWVTFMMWRVQEGLETHSGYHFRGSFIQKYLGLTNSYSTAFHDAHHVDNKSNYGEVIWDYLFGSLDYWLEMGGIEGYLEKRKIARENAIITIKNLSS